MEILKHTSRMSAGSEPIPDSIVGFRITQDAACRAARHTLCGAWWKRSSAFDAVLEPRAFRAIYVPFWYFYGTAECAYTGEWGEEEDFRDSDGNWQTDTYWHSIRGESSYDLDSAMLLCSACTSTAHLAGLFPYDMTDAEAYAPEAVGNASRAACTRTWEEAWKIAQKTALEMCRLRIRAELGQAYDTDLISVQSVEASYPDLVPELILLPLWECSFVHGGTTYVIHVNGQTGRVRGELPTSWLRVSLLAMAALGTLLLPLLFAMFVLSR